jgi:hypothetical protein
MSLHNNSFALEGGSTLFLRSLFAPLETSSFERGRLLLLVEGSDFLRCDFTDELLWLDLFPKSFSVVSSTAAVELNKSFLFLTSGDNSRLGMLGVSSKSERCVSRGSSTAKETLLCSFFTGSFRGAATTKETLFRSVFLGDLLPLLLLRGLREAVELLRLLELTLLCVSLSGRFDVIAVISVG